MNYYMLKRFDHLEVADFLLCCSRQCVGKRIKLTFTGPVTLSRDEPPTNGLYEEQRRSLNESRSRTEHILKERLIVKFAYQASHADSFLVLGEGDHTLMVMSVSPLFDKLKDDTESIWRASKLLTDYPWPDHCKVTSKECTTVDCVTHTVMFPVNFRFILVKSDQYDVDEFTSTLVDKYSAGPESGIRFVGSQSTHKSFIMALDKTIVELINKEFMTDLLAML